MRQRIHWELPLSTVSHTFRERTSNTEKNQKNSFLRKTVFEAIRTQNISIKKYISQNPLFYASM